MIRIVDDDEDMRESLSFLLESEGWKCSAYSSAREFLIEDAGSVPGCLILDIRMPEMTGLELQQEMNRRKIFCRSFSSRDTAVSIWQFPP
ncbi:response regulator [Parasutterella excrementihominis]